MKIKNYRPEIDGLRAIAVISVLIYHLKISINNFYFLNGGFLGVDIFFVISGYLISKIIFNELKITKSFNFYNFYVRRIKRIIPLLLIISISSLVLGYFYLLPEQLSDLFKSINSSIFFYSNYFFYHITSEYDAPSSLYLPLLHTWSLSVEEQFYFLFPLLIFLFYKLNKIKYFLLFLTLLSFLFSAYYGNYNSSLNFFFTLSRVWELLTGSIIAYYEIFSSKEIFKKYSKLLFLFGIFLIIFSINFIDNNYLHPGFLTLFPVLGSVLIILYGNKKGLCGAVLNNKLFVYIGTISFSLYLWHFLIFSFIRLNNFSIDIQNKLLILIFTLVISIISYHFIEKPFRYKKSICGINTLKIIFTTLILLIFISFFGFFEKFNDTWKLYGPKELVNTNIILKDTGFKFKDFMINKDCNLWISKFNKSDLERIKSCQKINKKSIFVLGDSHGMNFYNILSKSKPDNTSIIGIVNGGCRPSNCQKKLNHYTWFQQNVLSLVSSQDIILFHQSGSHLINDQNLKIGSNKPFENLMYTISDNHINQTMNFIKSIDFHILNKVIWVGPFVEYRRDLDKLKKSLINNEIIDEFLTINPNSWIIFNELNIHLNRLSKKNKVIYVPFSDILDINQNAIINDKSCFQFLNEDHFSKCGEDALSLQLANTSLFNYFLSFQQNTK
jgi:peptidoglycan/LPS O-acetylase OafA/YrhL